MFIRPIMALLAATMLTKPSLAEETTTWRLFVGDHAEGKVSAVDLGENRVIATFPLASPGALYTTDSAEAVFAVQKSGNQVSAIHTGISVDDHGDHGDIEIAEPALIDTVVAGERPVHFVEHDGAIALFFDGTGTTSVVDEQAWVEGQPLVPPTFDSGAAHHGVAVPWGEYTIISVPHPEDPTNLPIGVKVLDADGKAVGETHACADLHGEASSGNILAIACADGLLLVSGAGKPTIDKIAYSGLPEGKSTTLVGGQGLQYFLGNFGADKVVIIEPSAAEAFRLVDLPTRRVHFITDPIRPRFAYVFTEDGQLRQLDIVSGELVQSIAVTEPYSMDGEWSLPRPRIAVAGDVVAVTDPSAGKVHLVDIASFTIAGTIPVEGAPYSIVAAGGSGTSH